MRSRTAGGDDDIDAKRSRPSIVWVIAIENVRLFRLRFL